MGEGFRSNTVAKHMSLYVKASSLGGWALGRGLGWGKGFKVTKQHYMLRRPLGLDWGGPALGRGLGWGEGFEVTKQHCSHKYVFFPKAAAKGSFKKSAVIKHCYQILPKVLVK